MIRGGKFKAELMCTQKSLQLSKVHSNGASDLSYADRLVEHLYR